jgi:adenylate cyclase
MNLIKRIIGWFLKLTPFRISLLFTFVFIVLFIEKERGDLRSLDLIEANAYDIRFQSLHLLGQSDSLPQGIRKVFEKKSSDKVVIASIDERTVSHFGWPFPRSKWADFIARMREYGAKVVAFDVVFDQPGEYAGYEFLEATINKSRELGLDKYMDIERRRRRGDLERKVSEFMTYVEQKRKEANWDLLFAEELKKTDGIVLGWFGYRYQWEIETLKDQDFSDNAALLKGMSILPITKFDYPRLLRMFRDVSFVGLQTNLPALSENASFFGFFTASPEEIDGTIRRAFTIGMFTLDKENPSEENTYFYPSLSMAAIISYYNKLPRLNVGPLGAELYLGDKLIPTDKSGKVLINWMGPQHTYKYISIYDIITGFTDPDLKEEDRDPEKLLKDKIVLVGSEAIGVHDLRTTPFGTAPGVEMHANVVSNILNNDTLIQPEWFRMFDLAFILMVGIIFGLILPRMTAISGGIVTLIMFLGYLGTNIYLFVAYNYSFTIVFPLAEILFIYIGVTIYRYATEEREKRFIKGAFEHYLSPNVITQLMDDPGLLKLGGERKVLTAFFSDIQSFSTFSERMEPEDLVQFLNVYLTEMCDIVLKYNGTIDKFEGDAIIAFFGAPVDFDDHAAKAALCAAEIQERMVTLREKWKGEGLPEVHMRIGLNTGTMVVGNMGSRDRMDYTMMGNSVNLAARLEGAAKQYRIYSMISQFTRDAAGDVVETRELDSVQVVGIEEPVRVYEILGKKGAVSPGKMGVAQVFQEGLALYRQRQWIQAVERFEKALALDPKDGPSKVFIARCEEFSENPPGAGWDGVYRMTSK